MPRYNYASCIKLSMKGIKHEYCPEKKKWFFQFRDYPRHYHGGPYSQNFQLNKALDDKLAFLWKEELEKQSLWLEIV